jgi:diphosphomevalonate decarboxylase
MNKSSESINKIVAQASPNIALIKYWGNRDHHQRIPANSSISITLAGLSTTTSVSLDESLNSDQLNINQQPASEIATKRAGDLMDSIRSLSGGTVYARLESTNNFPMGAGIASSASAFAALTVAASRAYGLELKQAALSRLARSASGSAARSLCDGFVILHAGHDDHGSFAETLFPKDHWSLVDIVAVIDRSHKSISSSDGHLLADSSPIQSARVNDAPRRIEVCKQALANRDFDQLAYVTELDSNLMHAVMMTSSPSLLYWQAGTLALMKLVVKWRQSGVQVCYTIDAGPNVHLICAADDVPVIQSNLSSLDFILETFVSHPGTGAAIQLM